MSKRQYDSFMEMREYFREQVNQLEEMVGFLKPTSKDDELILKKLMSMLRILNDRMQEAESLSDVADIIDMEALEEDWDDISSKLSQYSESVEKEVDGYINHYVEGVS